MAEWQTHQTQKSDGATSCQFVSPVAGILGRQELRITDFSGSGFFFDSLSLLSLQNFISFPSSIFLPTLRYKCNETQRNSIIFDMKEAEHYDTKEIKIPH